MLTKLFFLSFCASFFLLFYFFKRDKKYSIIILLGFILFAILWERSFSECAAALTETINMR